jgi:hypothetical protein
VLLEANKRLRGGFLLRHAVESAQAENKIETSDPYDLAAGKERRELGKRGGIVRVIKRGNEDQSIRHVEIRIAGGEPLSVEENRVGHGQRFDAQQAAVLILHFAQ